MSTMDAVKEFYSKPTYLSLNKVHNLGEMSTKRGGGWGSYYSTPLKDLDKEIAFRKSVLKIDPFIKGPVHALVKYMMDRKNNK